MPNATPPAPPTTGDDERADLFDFTHLVSSEAAPAAFADEPSEVVVRAAAPPPRTRSFRRTRALQAAVAFAVGALAAVGFSAMDVQATTAAVPSAAITPEGAVPTKTLVAHPAAAPGVVPDEPNAPVHIASEDEERALEVETSRVRAAARVEDQGEIEVDDEGASEDDEAVDQEAGASSEDEEPVVEPAIVAESEEPSIDTANATMNELLHHAVAHLDEPNLPTHGGELEAEPEAVVEETEVSVGPDREDVQRVMEGLQPALLACVTSGHGLTHVQVTVMPNGRTRGVRVTGAFAGSPDGSCMARAARSVQFPQYEGDEPVTLRYPYRL